jgi:beta-galactosidase
MGKTPDPGVDFGAVYFRKTNPPRGDWERDYAVAAEDGHTLFRHWVPWGAVEVEPGVFDWKDYDRHLELAAEHGIRTILAEFCDNVPEWFHAAHPDARREDMNGRKWASNMHVSCVTGGAHAMCLDNPVVAEAAERYLRELAARYGQHPGLYGYDVWNECSWYSPHMVCYCPGTQARFREWLRGKYGNLETLGRAWLRYSFTDWDQVQLPRRPGLYPDFMDAVRFQLENTYRWMKWRCEVLRDADPDHLITAHGNAKDFCDIAPACGDDWRAAEHVDVFGYTYWQANRCHALMAGDMIRGASRGKVFWRAEAVGDSSWNGRRVGHPSPHHDAMHDPENIRLDALISLLAGARAYQTPRWRPLLDGPLFGAYGWYGMDGRRTERSRMVSSLAKWAREETPPELWQATPVRGEVALLICDEAQAWNYGQQGDTAFYGDCVQGAWEAFLRSNIQCDFIKLDQIGDYDLVYVPFPVALADRTAEALKAWVHAGGCMVAEGCFGYFNGAAHALPEQPNRGFAEVFGCTELTASFAPDIWDDLRIATPTGEVHGSLYRQSFTVTGGRAVGSYDDGSVAAVENRFGKGRVRLVGTMPSYLYHHDPGEASRKWFASALALAGVEPAVTVDREEIVARLWKGDGKRYLWVVNMSAGLKMVTAEPAGRKARQVVCLRGEGEAGVTGGRVRVAVPGRDAVVLALE